jgi:DNA-binding transcriptional ArsR family regulator
MRIIHILATTKNLTATDLSEKIGDVPRTTLYRHVKILLDHEILTIVSEKKVRGSLERTLDLNVEAFARNNSLENAPRQIFSFLMNKYASFHAYLNGERSETQKQTIFCNNTILMLDDGEFNQFLLELRDLLNKYNLEYMKGRRARDISVISTPTEIERNNEK